MLIAASFWWFLLVLSCIAYFGYGAVLMYHWFRYTLDGMSAIIASFAYYGFGVLMTLIMTNAVLAM